MTTPLLKHDRKRLRGHRALVGIDEAGRGPLAGPVVAAAVVLDADFLKCRWLKKHVGMINDSKQVDEAAREELFAGIEESGQPAFAVGEGSVAEIDAHNILGATRLAMQRAVERLAAGNGLRLVRNGEAGPDLFTTENRDSAEAEPAVALLVDGRPLKPFPYAHTAIVKGDATSLAIALASICAKVVRDRAMRSLHTEFPAYGFDAHKGYGTGAHREALREHGPCRHHRRKFLEKILNKPAEQILIPEF